MLLHYFAYGSNMHHGRLSARVASARSVAIARLPDHRLVFHKRGADGSGKASIVADSGLEVWGVLYTLSARHAADLDAIEGSGYERIRLEIQQSPAGDIVSAFSYRARPHVIEYGLQPYSWYLEFLLQGAAHHDLPAHYVVELGRITATIDTNSARARRARAQMGPGA